MKTSFPLVKLLLCAGLLTVGACSKPKGNVPAVDQGPIQKVRDLISKGRYEEALGGAKEISTQVPPGPFREEALYLQAYLLAFGRSDFQAARAPLHQLLDSDPTGKFSVEAQKLLADCQYWQGHYQTAGKEYKKLTTLYGGRGMDSYALLQMGICQLLDDKVDEGLSSFRELVEKYPTDPLADSAQMMVANSYLRLQNYKQAKTELQKLVALTRDKDTQEAAQKALRQIEEEEPLHKGVGVPQ